MLRPTRSNKHGGLGEVRIAILQSILKIDAGPASAACRGGILGGSRSARDVPNQNAGRRNPSHCTGSRLPRARWAWRLVLDSIHSLEHCPSPFSCPLGGLAALFRALVFELEGAGCYWLLLAAAGTGRIIIQANLSQIQLRHVFCQRSRPSPRQTSSSHVLHLHLLLLLPPPPPPQLVSSLDMRHRARHLD